MRPPRQSKVKSQGSVTGDAQNAESSTPSVKGTAQNIASIAHSRGEYGSKKGRFIDSMVAVDRSVLPGFL
jgi:hypothetical protein